jgi:hypothetical protein
MSYNYYNTLAWFYKFSKAFSSPFKFSFNNSDLSLSVRLRRSHTSYIPYISNSFSSRFNLEYNTFYIYIFLNSVRKSKKSNLFKFDFFDFRTFSPSISFYRLYKNFRFVFSTEFISIPDKLFFIGSYDPIKNNFYDVSFLSFFSKISSYCTSFLFFSFFQNFFLFLSIEFVLSFFMHIITFRFFLSLINFF